MKSFIRPLVLIYLLTITNLASAQNLGQLNLLSRGSEFYVGAESGKPMLTINLLDGVHTPGVYHIPVDTTLPQLIAFAGGAHERADLTDVVVRRRGPNPEILELNIERQIKSSGPLTVLHEGDTVQINSKSNMDRTLQWATIGATIASIALSIALISTANRR